MKIYFVRHGKTVHGGTGMNTGQADVPLNLEGEKQAEKLADSIPREVSIIYSSDFIRCKRTAEILNRNRQLPIVYDVRLRERDFGIWNDMPWRDFDPDGSIRKKDYAQEYDYNAQGGESAEDVKKRAFEWADDMKKKHRSGSVLAVTSGGVVRMVQYVLGGKADEKVPNGVLLEFNFPD